MRLLLSLFLSLIFLASAVEAGENLEHHFAALFKDFGMKSLNKIEIVSGPITVEMNNGKVPGHEWLAKCGSYLFKLTIQDATKAEITELIKRLQGLPPPYLRACPIVSDPGENGVAIYADLGGAAAHGSKQYINIVPNADSRVIAHEMGHTLEQLATETDAKILDKWEIAIKADKISVSNYGDLVRHEDLAEFSMIYAVCLNAGPAELDTLKKLSPGRFSLWENILRGRITQ